MFTSLWPQVELCHGQEFASKAHSSPSRSPGSYFKAQWACLEAQVLTNLVVALEKLNNHMTFLSL